MNSIDFAKWEDYIKKPDWYLKVISDVKAVSSLKEEDPLKWETLKHRAYDFFDTHLAKGDVFLGTKGKNWDAERKPIDTVVIHHTHMPPGLTENRLSGVILFRLYATYFANPYYEPDKEIQGQPIYSGHFRDGKQVFWPYHWIIRKGGKAERLLEDNEIGWHAGNWGVNCRSIAIVLDNNYEDSAPPKEEIEAIASLIRERYSTVPRDRILGHREVNLKTTCPSEKFLSSAGNHGWKEDVLSLLD